MLFGTFFLKSRLLLVTAMAGLPSHDTGRGNEAGKRCDGRGDE